MRTLAGKPRELLARVGEDARKDATYILNTVERSDEDRGMLEDLGYAGD